MDLTGKNNLYGLDITEGNIFHGRNLINRSDLDMTDSDLWGLDTMDRNIFCGCDGNNFKGLDLTIRNTFCGRDMTDGRNLNGHDWQE